MQNTFGKLLSAVVILFAGLLIGSGCSQKPLLRSSQSSALESAGGKTDMTKADPNLEKVQKKQASKNNPHKALDQKFTPINSGPFDSYKWKEPGVSAAISQPVNSATDSATVNAKPDLHSKNAPLDDRSQPPEKSPRPSQNAEADAVTFNFNDADLSEVIRTLADLLEINYIVDGTINGKATVHTAGKIKKSDLLPLFFQLLEINGLTAVKEGSLYRIVTIKEAPRMQIMNSKDLPTSEKITIEFIPLEFIAPDEMINLLTPFLSSFGTLISNESSKTLLVVDKAINIQKIRQLVKAFDVEIFDRAIYRFFTLNHMTVKEAGDTLKSILDAYASTQRADLNLIPIERLNMLLAICSSERTLSLIEEFIRQLDVPSQQTDPRIYIYSIKNARAEELATLLQSVFLSGENTTAEKPAQTAAETPEKGQKPTNNKPFDQPKPQESKPSNAVLTSSFSSGTIQSDLKITPDITRNLLIIEATPRDYQIIESVIKRLDVLPRQVLIEVQIADISLDESNELGVEWSFLEGASELSTTLLEASAGSAGLKYVIGKTDKWTSKLTALAQENKVDMLSSPSVLASDNKPAQINISTEVPIVSAQYQYETSTEPLVQTDIQYRNTGILLSVTPHINEHGLVSMDISQEVSEQSDAVTIGDESYSSFFNRNIETTLTVKNGQTIVIGGLMRESTTKTNSGLPLLNKLPFIKYLFGQNKKSVSKTELILLITPHVIVDLDDVEAVSEEFKKRIGRIR